MMTDIYLTEPECVTQHIYEGINMRLIRRNPQKESPENQAIEKPHNNRRLVDDDRILPNRLQKSKNGVSKKTSTGVSCVVERHLQYKDRSHIGDERRWWNG